MKANINLYWRFFHSATTVALAGVGLAINVAA
jgi:hypothetical protein